MRKIIGLLTAGLILVSCGKNENEMTFNATIKGFKKGTVYLQKITDSTLINLDSVVVRGNESFSLSTIVENPEVYYLYVDKVDASKFNDRVSFFAEKGEYSLITHIDKLNEEIHIKGGKAQKIYEKYNKYISPIDKLLAQAQIRLTQAQITNDEDAIIAAEKALSKLITSKYLRAIQFALNHKKSAVAAYIGAREIPEANVQYLDSIYNGLNKKIKRSVYGIELKEIITTQKAE